MKQIKTYLYLILQLCVLLFVVSEFNIQQDARLDLIFLIVVSGFSIHYWLPIKWKLPFFALLTPVALFSVIGVVPGSLVILIGLALVGICHLPIGYYYRIALLWGCIVLLILFRSNIIPLQTTGVILPFVGTMFMLRIFSYAYELKYAKQQQSFWTIVSYFFMLPNISFPLFPIVDFKAFHQTYLQRDSVQIYKLAVRRIFRGLVQLLMYRYIYYFLLPPLDEITNVIGVLQFMIFGYSLVLQLSGMFHLALGMLGLFGFDLPDAFNNYFLASNFNDLWRRINSYWRDLLMKIFYYPIYFRLKQLPTTIRIAITILIVFAINWLLHGYQWFWVQGQFPIKFNDALYWAIFGVVIMLNSIYIHKKGRQKAIKQSSTWSIRSASIKVLKPLGVFSFMCVFWTMWTSKSFAEWLYLMTFLSKGSSVHFLIVGISLVGGFTLLMLINYSYKKGALKRALALYARNGSIITAIMVLLLVPFSFTKLNDKIGAGIINELKVSRLNVDDLVEKERGYYQTMLNDEAASIQLWQSKQEQPKNWFSKNHALRNTNNILFRELTPNQEIVFKGADLTTNQWGMRDQEYSLEKPAGTLRFTLFGGSYVLGSGVDDDDNFESITERELNKIYANPVEILNFGVGGYLMPQRLYAYEFKGLKFNPDAVLYVAHGREGYRVRVKLSRMIRAKIDLVYPKLKEIVKNSGAKAWMSELEIRNRLKPYIKEIMQWGYTRVSKLARLNNSLPIWIYLPVFEDSNSVEEFQEAEQLAKKCGFVIISLRDVYGDRAHNELQIAKWDTHPNEFGHQLIADKLIVKLDSVITQNKDQLLEEYERED